MNGANITGSAALLPWIQEVCASERRLEAHLADLKQLEEGSLHIVAFTSTLTQWLPQITKRFTEAHPHIDLRITCCDDQHNLSTSRNRARTEIERDGVGRCAGLHRVHERLDPRSRRKRSRGAVDLGASKNEAGAIPTSFRLRYALLHDPHLEGAHENHGHALAGDGIAGPEVLARRLVVALDEALRRRPGEGAARPA